MEENSHKPDKCSTWSSLDLCKWTRIMCFGHLIKKINFSLIAVVSWDADWLQIWNFLFLSFHDLLKRHFMKFQYFEKKKHSVNEFSVANFYRFVDTNEGVNAMHFSDKKSKYKYKIMFHFLSLHGNDWWIRLIPIFSSNSSTIA